MEEFLTSTAGTINGLVPVLLLSYDKDKLHYIIALAVILPVVANIYKYVVSKYDKIVANSKGVTVTYSIDSTDPNSLTYRLNYFINSKLNKTEINSYECDSIYSTYTESEPARRYFGIKTPCYNMWYKFEIDKVVYKCMIKKC